MVFSTLSEASPLMVVVVLKIEIHPTSIDIKLEFDKENQELCECSVNSGFYEFEKQ